MVLQETKKEEMDERWVVSLWKARFRNWVALPSIGRARGIVVLWDRRKTEVIESLVGEFSVSVKVKEDKGEWWLTGVYGPNSCHRRDEFWVELAGLSEICGPRWCVGGDFNVVQFTNEKFPQGRAKRGIRCFAKGKFTWSNFRENATKSKLDRFLFSGGWEEFFPLVRQEYGDRVCSDYFAIILDTSQVTWGPTPFCFENMWLGDPKFKPSCKCWWDSLVVSGWEGYKFMEKLKGLRGPIKRWNKEVFGDTREIKREIIKKIQRLNKKEEENSLEDFEVLERRRLMDMLEDVILKESIAWKQKMKLRWIKEWDNNSRLFHILVNNRRNKNAISRLEREDGSFLEDQREIEWEITSFYERLFTENHDVNWSFQGFQWEAITRDKADWLERSFDMEEIKKVVFGCDRDKSPGSDGFIMAFYQDCWDMVKEDLFSFFEEFYRGGVVNSAMNHTILCLIPKKSESKYVKDFRPISLVSSVYKILAKVLAN